LSSQRVHSARSLEQYMRCPRQYYYSRVLKLGSGEEDSAYFAFHRCLWNVIRWWRDQRASGATPKLRELQARLNDEWTISGPDPAHPHESLLRARADQILSALNDDHSLLASDSVAWPIEAQIGEAIIRVEPDGIRVDSAGTPVVEKWYFGKPSNR